MSGLLNSIGILLLILFFVLIFGRVIKTYEGMENSTADPREKQIAAAIQNSAPDIAHSITSINSAIQAGSPNVINTLVSPSPTINQSQSLPNTNSSYGNSGNPINNVKTYNF